MIEYYDTEMKTARSTKEHIIFVSMPTLIMPERFNELGIKNSPDKSLDISNPKLIYMEPMQFLKYTWKEFLISQNISLRNKVTMKLEKELKELGRSNFIELNKITPECLIAVNEAKTFDEYLKALKMDYITINRIKRIMNKIRNDKKNRIEKIPVPRLILSPTNICLLHEGRSRAIAAMDEGLELIPVFVNSIINPEEN